MIPPSPPIGGEYLYEASPNSPCRSHTKEFKLSLVSMDESKRDVKCCGFARSIGAEQCDGLAWLSR